MKWNNEWMNLEETLNWEKEVKKQDLKTKLAWFIKSVKDKRKKSTFKEKYEDKTELELYKILNKEEKKKYIDRIEKKTKIIFWISIIILMWVLSYWSVEYFNYEFKKAVSSNLELQKEADELASKIEKASSSDLLKERFKDREDFNIEKLLQEVTLNWKMAKLILDNRDEVIFALETIEDIIPNWTYFELLWIKRNWPNVYAITSNIRLEEWITKNDAIRLVARTVSVFDKSKSIMAAKKISAMEREKYNNKIEDYVNKTWRAPNRDKKIEFAKESKFESEERERLMKRLELTEPSFNLEQFAWTTYSASDNSFPFNIIVTYNQKVEQPEWNSENK